MRNDASRVPTESNEQQALFKWAKMQSAKHEELELLYHIPNEGKRSYAQGRKMRAEGLKSGVPDICLPVPKGCYSSLYIELKRTKGGRVSDSQEEWLCKLNRHGNLAIVCRGWEEAAKVIMHYIGAKKND